MIYEAEALLKRKLEKELLERTRREIKIFDKQLNCLYHRQYIEGSKTAVV